MELICSISSKVRRLDEPHRPSHRLLALGSLGSSQPRTHMRFAVGALGEGMDTSRMPWPLATMTRPDAAMFNAGILSHRDQLDPVHTAVRKFAK